MNFHQFQKFQVGQSWFAKDYFVYNIPQFNLGSGAGFNTNFAIQADSDFEWVFTTYSGVIVGDVGFGTAWADNNVIPITLNISDGGSGRNLFSGPIPMVEIAGPGRQPYFLPKSRIFLGKSTVNLAFTNYSTTAYDDISFSLHGNKIFNLSGG